MTVFTHCGETIYILVRIYQQVNA